MIFLLETRVINGYSTLFLSHLTPLLYPRRHPNFSELKANRLETKNFLVNQKPLVSEGLKFMSMKDSLLMYMIHSNNT